jgi:hypothetical protein
VLCHKQARNLGMRIHRNASPVSVVCKRLYETANDAFLECEKLWLK